MPYIKKERREQLDDCGDSPSSSGELNYLITVLIRNYYNTYNKRGYQTISEIIGAIEGAKLEFERRIVREYEDKKIAENGDVY